MNINIHIDINMNLDLPAPPHAPPPPAPLRTASAWGGGVWGITKQIHECVANSAFATVFDICMLVLFGLGYYACGISYIF